MSTKEKHVAVYIDVAHITGGLAFLVTKLITDRPVHKTTVIFGNHGVYDPDANIALSQDENVWGMMGEAFGLDPRDEPREWLMQYMADGKMRWQFVAEALLLPEFTFIEWNE